MPNFEKITMVFDSVLNYTESSRWSAEYSHRDIAYLDKFLMLLFHPYEFEGNHNIVRYSIFNI